MSPSFTKERVRAELAQILRDHAEEGADIVGSAHIVGNLGLDSLGVMEVIAAIEDTFAISIPEDSLKHLSTVDDVLTAVEKHLETDRRLSP